MKKKVIAILSWIFTVSSVTLSHADEFKQDLFILGVQLGGAECMASLHESFPTREKPGALELIRRNLEWSIDTAQRMGNPANSLTQLRNLLDELSFAEIRSRLMASIESEQMSSSTLSTQASGLFILGVHLEGAECVASGVQEFSRDEKPGSLVLIRRNIEWIQQEVRNVDLGLNTSLVDELMSRLDGGASFTEITNRLAEIRLQWQQELEAQNSF